MLEGVHPQDPKVGQEGLWKGWRQPQGENVTEAFQVKEKDLKRTGK